MENELIELLEEFIDFLRMKDEEEVLVEEEELYEPEELDEAEGEQAFSAMIDEMSQGG